MLRAFHNLLYLNPMEIYSLKMDVTIFKMKERGHSRNGWMYCKMKNRLHKKVKYLQEEKNNNN